jgi:hypothetical protein
VKANEYRQLRKRAERAARVNDSGTEPMDSACHGRNAVACDGSDGLITGDSVVVTRKGVAGSIPAVSTTRPRRHAADLRCTDCGCAPSADQRDEIDEGGAAAACACGGELLCPDCGDSVDDPCGECATFGERREGLGSVSPMTVLSHALWRGAY